MGFVHRLIVIVFLVFYWTYLITKPADADSQLLSFIVFFIIGAYLAGNGDD